LAGIFPVPISIHVTTKVTLCEWSEDMNEKVETPFKGKAVSSYNQGPPRQVPGYSDLHRMISLLLAEVTPQGGRLLVRGAGGGQEIKALADAHAGWSFDGVDPSADMLQLANTVIAAH
jgi:tRNA (cmo5U34)-methyltransferase